MTRDFALPDLGEGLRDAEIREWHVAEGDTVTLNQTLAEVETAKAVVELPSPYAGVIRGLHAQAGDVVLVGARLVSIETGEEDAAGSPPAEPVEDAAVPNLVGYGAAAAGRTAPRRRPRVWAGKTGAPAPPAASGGVSLPGADTAAPDAPSAAPRTDRRIPIRGVRRHTAEAMVRSAFTAPHATAFLTVDVTPTVEMLARWREDPELGAARIGLLAVVARASVLALRRTPGLNASWDADAEEIVEHGAVHLGVAAATERGLVVPVIRDADLMGTGELAAALRDLADTARAGRSAPRDLSGSTFSLSNVGALGLDGGTPLLNPGESGILAVGAARRIPWESEGRIALRHVLTLSLSFDHRIVDGAEAARFLRDVGGMLSDPGRALLAG
ncbi:dihydrolipoamide acetyltransferase family protein [Microbacterium caowuchunii]|uniref:Dihydrolipoamide acetyltransferase component of pyruvate dehydrogenase complex n=1 Tax=Microbacterium caowuchunii TaxID=2614638 RepID=A0A5N0TNZ3_9MICO|nr:dihydrolipoamide acetyltransferase family protein [Microbacterium caowuchunii]KAA9135109.1 2-oxo acid dehydrogenase subunit E2 [Microbacterium caowuchunii]